MKPVYQVVATKSGYAVQNSRTFHIVGVYANNAEATRICTNLNDPKQGIQQPRKVYVVR